MRKKIHKIPLRTADICTTDVSLGLMSILYHHWEEEMKKKLCWILALGCVFMFVACDNDDDDHSPVQTTLTQTWMPIPKDGESGFNMVIGAGEPHQVRTLSDTTPEPSGNFWSLGYFLVMTDQHVTDEQSPARSAFFDTKTVFFGMFEAAYRPQEDLATQLVDAAVRTANSLNCDYNRNLDMVVALGDFADNGETAEFDWALQTMNGSVDEVAPWTGTMIRDLGTQQAYDPYERPGYYNSNYAFPVVGLKKCDGSPMVWYSAIGNHDVLNIGNFPVDMPEWPLNNFFFTADTYKGGLSPFGYLRGLPSLVVNTLDQANVPAQAFYNRLTFQAQPNMADAMGNFLSDPLNMRLLLAVASDGEAAVRADVDPNFNFGQLNAVNPAVTKNQIGVHVEADQARAFLGPKRLFKMLRNEGHGCWATRDACTSVFPGGVDPDEGYYTLDYKTSDGLGIPLRLIFMNTDEKPLSAVGGMSKTQWDWLVCQLERAAMETKLVIVLSHIPEDGVFTIPGVCLDGQCEGAFESLFQSYPNVIGHLAGHTHKNQIRTHADAKDPDNGYWEVITCSTQVYPQQTRILEVVVHENGVGELWSTMLDHDDTLGPDPAVNELAAAARNIGVNDPQIGINKEGLPSEPGTPLDRNVVLRFWVPPEYVSVIQSSLTPSSVIQSRDVLPGGVPR